MGAGQTYQWITQYPDFMDLAAPFCGSARTSIHNQVFLEGVKSALLAAKNQRSGGVFLNGDNKREEWTDNEKEIGLKALGRVYAGWFAVDSSWIVLQLTYISCRGFSQAFYRERLHEKHFGYKDLESFIAGFWEKWACSKRKICFNFSFTPMPIEDRSRKYASYVTNMASSGLFMAKALQWRFRKSNAEY